MEYCYTAEEYYFLANYGMLIGEVKRMNQKADDILYRISLAADSLTYIAYGIELQDGNDCEEANAIHYIAHCLKEQSKDLRKLIEAGD